MLKIAFLNKKGGVGKTVIGINSAYLIVKDYLKENEKSLYIDCDPQGNSTAFFYDLEKNEKPKFTLKDLFINPKLDIKKTTVQARINVDDSGKQEIIPNLDIIVSNDILDKEIENIKSLNKKKILFNHLKNIENEYKFCFLDCPPKISSIIENILFAADLIIIPIESDGDALEAMITLLENAYKVKEVKRLDDINYWILWNTFDAKSRILNKWTLNEIKDYKHRLLDTRIRKKDIYTKSKSFRKVITLFKGKCKREALEDLNNFLKEVFERNKIEIK